MASHPSSCPVLIRGTSCSLLYPAITDNRDLLPKASNTVQGTLPEREGGPSPKQILKLKSTVGAIYTRGSQTELQSLLQDGHQMRCAQRILKKPLGLQCHAGGKSMVTARNILKEEGTTQSFSASKRCQDRAWTKASSHTSLNSKSNYRHTSDKRASSLVPLEMWAHISLTACGYLPALPGQAPKADLVLPQQHMHLRM